METAEERLRRRSTPLVRKMAAEHNLDLSAIPGTGLAGRVTKNDVLGYLDSGVAAPAAAPALRPRPHRLPSRQPRRRSPALRLPRASSPGRAIGSSPGRGSGSSRPSTW